MAVVVIECLASLRPAAWRVGSAKHTCSGAVSRQQTHRQDDFRTGISRDAAASAGALASASG